MIVYWILSYRIHRIENNSLSNTLELTILRASNSNAMSDAQRDRQMQEHNIIKTTTNELMSRPDKTPPRCNSNACSNNISTKDTVQKPVEDDHDEKKD